MDSTRPIAYAKAGVVTESEVVLSVGKKVTLEVQERPELAFMLAVAVTQADTVPHVSLA